MPSKIVDVPGIGAIRLVKSARNRSIRLAITNTGVRVSMPRWTPYVSGIAFATQHARWIREHRISHTKPILKEGDKIGKLHVLHFNAVAEGASLRTSVTPTKLIIPVRPGEDLTSSSVQDRAEAAAMRALKREAQVLLPHRLAEAAKKHRMSYGSVTIKNLKRRWGSCDSHQNITLNIYLMQLSWQQIDYVLYHELAHTEHMNHSADFWRRVESMLPDARMIAKKVRYIQPALKPVSNLNTSASVD